MQEVIANVLRTRQIVGESCELADLRAFEKTFKHKDKLRLVLVHEGYDFNRTDDRLQGYPGIHYLLIYYSVAEETFIELERREYSRNEPYYGWPLYIQEKIEAIKNPRGCVVLDWTLTSRLGKLCNRILAFKYRCALYLCYDLLF